MKAKHWVALAVALLTLVGILIEKDVIHWRSHPQKYISGVVSDSVTRLPVPGVVVQLQTNAGKQLGQDATDGEGKFSVAILGDTTDVRLHVAVDGYEPYDEKLPAQEAKNDIHLVQLPMVIGISDGTPLNKALPVVAKDLGITASLSIRCSGKATTAPVNGVELRGDPRVPAPFLNVLINSVKNSGLRYGITKIEERRYEIDCL